MSLPHSVLFHEEAVTREPYEVKSWLQYLSHLSSLDPPHPCLHLQVFERAVAALPGSYKLWYMYRTHFRNLSLKYHPNHAARYASLSVSFRAARALQRAPVLWKETIEHILQERVFTKLRLTLNEALRLLPVLQHDMVWIPVLDAVKEGSVPVDLSVFLLRRYSKLRPEAVELLYTKLLQAQRWDDAVVEMCQALIRDDWVPEGKGGKEARWMEVARIAAKHPKKITSIDVPKLLRSAIKGAVTDIGELWVVFGEYYIRQAQFDEASKIYEEAMSSVSVVRDFVVVFDAYTKFMESVASAQMEDVEVIEEEEGEGDELKEAKEALEGTIAKLEDLTERRPMLLSDICLRQNPHNVHEWHKRARLFKKIKDATNAVRTYTSAVQTVDPWRATNGRPHTLWLAFARYYEDAKDLASARTVLDKAVSNPDGFRSAEDLAAVWCEYAEMELRCTTPQKALSVLRRATEVPERIKQMMEEKKRGQMSDKLEAFKGLGEGRRNLVAKYKYDNSSPAWNAYKSMRVWHFLIDLTHSIGTTEEVIALHYRLFEHRIASPQTIMSGAEYLESKRLFEQAFRLYDKGTSVLSWPAALEVWVVYLTKFEKRFGSSKLERARDLYEEAIRSAPSKRRRGHEFAHPELRLLFMMYAAMEERRSLARHSLQVLARATKAVRVEDRPDMYRLYIFKTANFFGVTKTRHIYEDALVSLTQPQDVLEFAIRYAAMEARVGEVERSRAVYVQSCKIADPRRRGFYDLFWKSWNEFELEHGNEDTFRDMLRQKRYVQLNHKDVVLDEDRIDTTNSGEDGGLRGMIRDSQVLSAGGNLSIQETEAMEAEARAIEGT